jgi:hypothetical protein
MSGHLPRQDALCPSRGHCHIGKRKIDDEVMKTIETTMSDIAETYKK